MFTVQISRHEASNVPEAKMGDTVGQRCGRENIRNKDIRTMEVIRWKCVASIGEKSEKVSRRKQLFEGAPLVG